MSPRDPLNFFFVGGLAASHYVAGRTPKQSIGLGSKCSCGLEVPPGIASCAQAWRRRD
jgi:hypothetical protein